MNVPLVLVSGFGPFEEVTENPSGAVAQELARRPPEGLKVVGGILPVSFRRAPEAWDGLLASAGSRPSALLSLGAQPDPGYRLELRARGVLENAERADVDGGVAGRGPGTAPGEAVELATDLDLDRLVEVLRRAGAADVSTSTDAGGYVCERIYHHVLVRGAELGVPALFLHVPPLGVESLERQVVVTTALVREMVRAAS